MSKISEVFIFEAKLNLICIDAELFDREWQRIHHARILIVWLTSDNLLDKSLNSRSIILDVGSEGLALLCQPQLMVRFSLIKLFL